MHQPTPLLSPSHRRPQRRGRALSPTIANIGIGGRQDVSPTFYDHPTELDALLSDGGYPVAPRHPHTTHGPDPPCPCINRRRSQRRDAVGRRRIEPATRLQGSRTQTRTSPPFHPAPGEVHEDADHRPLAMGSQSHQVRPGSSRAWDDRPDRGLFLSELHPSGETGELRGGR